MYPNRLITAYNQVRILDEYELLYMPNGWEHVPTSAFRLSCRLCRRSRAWIFLKMLSMDPPIYPGYSFQMSTCTCPFPSGKNFPPTRHPSIRRALFRPQRIHGSTLIFLMPSYISTTRLGSSRLSNRICPSTPGIFLPPANMFPSFFLSHKPIT